MQVLRWLVARSEDDGTGVAAEVEGREGHALPLRCDVTCRLEAAGLAGAVSDTTGPMDLLGAAGPTPSPA